MTYIQNIEQCSIKIERIPKPLYVPRYIYIWQRDGVIYLKISNKVIGLTTITAHRIGLDIQKKLIDLDGSESLSLVIDGEKIEFIPDVIKKISVGLLRKADDADDWQLMKRAKS